MTLSGTSTGRGPLVPAFLAALAVTVPLGLAEAAGVHGPTLTALGFLLTAGAAVVLLRAAGATAAAEAEVAGRTAHDRAGEFVDGLRDDATRITAAGQGLRDVTDRVRQGATNGSAAAADGAHAAESVTHEVAAAASGTEQMSASIEEIARNAREATVLAEQGAAAVGSATATMSKLGESSRSIGEVLHLVMGIAEQTNLLALNATIEAARAGTAGKGFAVVADEVKQLAQEAARATEEIGRRVGTVQEAAERAGSEVAQVTTVIAAMTDYQTVIAGAVEEQSAVTRHMVDSLARAAESSARIVEVLTAQSGAASRSVAAMQEAGEHLAQLEASTGRLTGALDGGVDGVRP